MLLPMMALASTSLYARPSRVWTQQELYDESDLVAIVTSAEPERVENSDGFLTDWVQQYESTLTVQATLKGEEKPKTIILVHFRPRKDSRTTLGNGPTYVWMGTKLIGREGEAKRMPFYLVYLHRRDDGKFEPVSGNMDPADSIVRILPFPEWDPALGTTKTPEQSDAREAGLRADSNG